MGIDSLPGKNFKRGEFCALKMRLKELYAQFWGFFCCCFFLTTKLGATMGNDTVFRISFRVID